MSCGRPIGRTITGAPAPMAAALEPRSRLLCGAQKDLRYDEPVERVAAHLSRASGVIPDVHECQRHGSAPTDAGAGA
jgi:hypothetical protein